MQAAMDALVESSQGDMRMMLGQLQMHRLRAVSLSYSDVQASSAKDMDKSPFECARLLLSTDSTRMRMSDRMDCVFQDMDLVPLLIQVRSLCCIASLPICVKVHSLPCRVHTVLLYQNLPWCERCPAAQELLVEVVSQCYASVL
jgi:hypothetical protein